MVILLMAIGGNSTGGFYFFILGYITIIGGYFITNYCWIL